MSTAGYLDRFLAPVTDSFNREFAAALAELRADPNTQAQMDALRQKANLGGLSEAEEEDYKSFVEALDVISILQSKARQYLSRQSA